MKYLVILFVFFGITVFSQNSSNNTKVILVDKLLDSLVANPTSFFNRTDPNWQILCNNLQHVDMQKLNQIASSIFVGSKPIIENESSSSEGLLGSLNKSSHDKKLKKFNKKYTKEFRNKQLFPNNKIVLVEGDSWFEYPLFLREITDNLTKQDNLAVYSMASGGDWAANMISSTDYQEEYLSIKPDVFIISGGGNDIVEDNRLMNLILDKPYAVDDPFLKDYREYVVLRQNNKPVPMCNANFCPIEYHLFKDSITQLTSNVDGLDLEKIVNGRRFLNNNYYRWLVTFKLEYKILFESLRKLDSANFDSLKIITQGYDYAIPNSNKKFGVRLLMENGKWIKKPLELIGITDQYTQESIIMAIMFDFNEMLIELGKEYNNIYHVDVRGFTRYLEAQDNKKPGTYWFDELHPTNEVFAEISQTYITIINDNVPKDKRVFNVIQYFEENDSQPHNLGGKKINFNLKN
jgi:hypothetical protein